MNDPLEQVLPQTFSLVSSVKIPNIQPTITDVPYRLAVIGDSPVPDDETCLTPFSGQAGRLLDSILGSTGIHRSACFIGNVCKYVPPRNAKGQNDIEEFDIHVEKTVKGSPKLVRLKGSYMQHEKGMKNSWSICTSIQRCCGWDEEKNLMVQ